jgi:phage-related protein
MNVHEFRSVGGKSYIRKFLDTLSAEEKSFGEDIILHLEEEGLDGLDTKRWQGKIWEIYFPKHNRIFYVTQNDNDIYLLHACKKQKNKTEKADREVVIKRTQILEIQLGRKLI